MPEAGDENSLGGRLKRYAQVSSTVGGVAARMVGEKYLGVQTNRDDHARAMKGLLGHLKGPLMKVAQFLATVPDALPREYAAELMELQNNAPPMGWLFVNRRMKGELGPEWESKFQSFERDASAAASLGQVHKALSLEGKELACKLQYPDMAAAVQADLSQLKFFFSLYESFGKALETRDVQEEISQRLEEELDYEHEARNISLYRGIFGESASSISIETLPGIHIPSCYPSLSTKRLLTMSWMEGRPILSFINEDAETRNHLAKLLFWSWYYPFYHYGVLHGDPHPGNYSVREDLSLNILDFGCVRVFPASFIQGVIGLFEALRDEDQEKAVHAYETWGFKNLSHDIIEVITHWARLLYDPLLEDRVRPIQRAHSGQAGWETALKVHEELSRLGGIRPPREFVFMDRAAVGIGSVIMRLQAEHNWHRLFQELIEGFDAAIFSNRQQALLDSVK